MSVKPPPLPPSVVSSCSGQGTSRRGRIPRANVFGFLALVLFLAGSAAVAFLLGVSAGNLDGSNPREGAIPIALDIGGPEQPDADAPQPALADVAPPRQQPAPVAAPQDAVVTRQQPAGPKPAAQAAPTLRERPERPGEDPEPAIKLIDNFPPCPTGQCADDRTLGTALTWAESPQEAADVARRTGKLLFILHVSGNFEQEDFT